MALFRSLARSSLQQIVRETRPAICKLVVCRTGPAVYQHYSTTCGNSLFTGHLQTNHFCSKSALSDVMYEDLIALINSGDIQLIDVREPHEVKDLGYIPKSVNIPLGELKPALTMTDDEFLSKYHIQKPRSYDANIVFYGLGPIKSKAAVDLANKFGFKKARHYPGGFEEWIKMQK